MAASSTFPVIAVLIEVIISILARIVIIITIIIMTASIAGQTLAACVGGVGTREPAPDSVCPGQSQHDYLANLVGPS
jgi:hypothetical protein